MNQAYRTLDEIYREQNISVSESSLPSRYGEGARISEKTTYSGEPSWERRCEQARYDKERAERKQKKKLAREKLEQQILNRAFENMRIEKAVEEYCAYSRTDIN